MQNKYFPDEEITKNDLHFVCYMIERVARKLRQRNRYVVNSIPKERWIHLLSVANVLHRENPLKVEAEWIEEYGLKPGDFNISDVTPELCEKIPSPQDVSQVYERLILATLQPEEDWADGLIRVYNHPICVKIDDYNCSAYYEPSYFIARAYFNGGF